MLKLEKTYQQIDRVLMSFRFIQAENQILHAGVLELGCSLQCERVFP